MFRELFLYSIWSSLWIGFFHNLNKYSSTFQNYPINVKNNIVSFTHSILSVFLAGRFLTQTKHYANIFLYNQALSNTSLTNLSHFNESLRGDKYYYVNMLEVYNYVADPWSFTLLSLQAMSVCYFVADIVYILKHGLIYTKAPYIFHHVMMILLHYYAYTSENTYEYINMYYYGELSNFFTYTTYHFIKTNNKQMVYISSLCQCVWFTIFRVFVYSYFLIHYLVFSSLDSIFMKLFCPVIYLMGLMWGYNLWKTTYESVKQRNHIELVVKVFYDTINYLQNTLNEVKYVTSALFNNKKNDNNDNNVETKNKKTTQQVTKDSTDEPTDEQEVEQTVDDPDIVGFTTYDPLEDNRTYTLRKRPIST